MKTKLSMLEYILYLTPFLIVIIKCKVTLTYMACYA